MIPLGASVMPAAHGQVATKGGMVHVLPLGCRRGGVAPVTAQSTGTKLAYAMLTSRVRIGARVLGRIYYIFC